MSGRSGSPLWSPEALRDLDQIWNYYEGVAGANVAERVVRKIGKAVATIETYPLAGRVRNELLLGLHSFAATPHVVFYRVTDNGPQIIRILDNRRNIDEIFLK